MAVASTKPFTTVSVVGPPAPLPPEPVEPPEPTVDVVVATLELAVVADDAPPLPSEDETELALVAPPAEEVDSEAASRSWSPEQPTKPTRTAATDRTVTVEA